ncbi:hypothetical protein LCGC14_1817470 [marine sediment metagenome]|uniref:Uncharacterized protein n=1 Tax=marine sediment metagenome TaxID=412755 RepID=A0A0F9GJY6_9ZZZZ
MATGDVLVFQEARAYMIDGGWEAADDIKCAILDNTLTPAVGDLTPALADYTEVGAAGSYVAGGLSLGTLGTAVAEAAGVMTFDSATNPTWAQDALSDVDAWWGLVYHVLTGQAIAFVELGGPVNMQAGDLTITWAAGGIFTIT